MRKFYKAIKYGIIGATTLPPTATLGKKCFFVNPLYKTIAIFTQKDKF